MCCNYDPAHRSFTNLGSSLTVLAGVCILPNSLWIELSLISTSLAPPANHASLMVLDHVMLGTPKAVHAYQKVNEYS